MMTILSTQFIPIIMLFCSAKNTDTVDINIKSADKSNIKCHPSEYRFNILPPSSPIPENAFQNIRKSVISVDWVGNPTSIKVV